LPATRVTTGAVRSYRTFSPLPAFALRPSGSGLRRGRLLRFRELASPKLAARRAESEGGRCLFCATFLQVTLTGRYPAHCPAEFGLSSRRSLRSRRRRAVAWLTATINSTACRPGRSGGSGRSVDRNGG